MGSDYHWTICISFKLSEETEAALVGWRVLRDLTPEQKEARRAEYKAWRKNLRDRIPRNGKREIYYPTEAKAKAAFVKAGLNEKEYEIRRGFFL